MAALPLVSVNLATVVIESMLYGMFVILSGASTYFHHTRVSSQRRGSPRKFTKHITPLFCGSVLIFGTITGVSNPALPLAPAYE